MMMGRVDEVDGNFVATRFVALVVPTQCLYVPKNTSRPSVTGSTSEVVPIRRSWRSVALGYGRVWLPVLAVGLFVFDSVHEGVRLATTIASLVLLGVSAAAHLAGRLPEDQKEKLRLLGTVTGLRIDPSKLRPATREKRRALLGDLMEKAGIPMTPQGIISVLDDIPGPALPLVYGYACYAGDDPTWRQCATIIYGRHLESAL